MSSGKNQPDSADARREAWLRGVRDRVTATMSPTLANDAEQGAMDAATQAIHSLTDENIAMIEQAADRSRKLGATIPQIACKKGCDYCCTLRVKAAVPEVFAIADHIQKTWTDEQKARLRIGMDDYQKQLEGLTPLQNLNKMIPCPLLKDHLCTVHAVRPLSCRKHHSVDLQVCIQAQKQPDKVQIPHYLEIDTVVAPIMTGIQSAMKSKSLRSGTVMLVPALQIALGDSDAKTEWLDGEDVFAPAVDKGIDALAFIRTKRIPTYEV